MSKTKSETQLTLAKPSEIIFYMLDEATRRTDLNSSGEFGMHDKTLWHHEALARRIDEYIQRHITQTLTSLKTEMEKKKLYTPIEAPMMQPDELEFEVHEITVHNKAISECQRVITELTSKGEEG